MIDGQRLHRIIKRIEKKKQENNIPGTNEKKFQNKKRKNKRIK